MTAWLLRLTPPLAAFLRTPRQPASGRPAGDSGAASVEFGLLVLPLVIVIGGLIDFGIVYNAQISVMHAAHEGARLSAMNPTADVNTRVIETAQPTVALTA